MSSLKVYFYLRIEIEFFAKEFIDSFSVFYKKKKINK